MPDLFPYSLIYFLSIFVFFYGKNKTIYWSFFVLLCFFFTFRSLNVGGDTEQYYYAYADIKSASIFNWWRTSVIEFGFALMNKIIYYISGGSFRWFLLISSVGICFPVFYYGETYFKYGHRIVSLFVLQYDYLYSYTFIAQYLAIAIIFAGFVRYTKKENNKELIAFILIATTFHSSSLVLLILIPFLKKNINISLITICLCLSYFIGRSGLLGFLLNSLGVSTMYSHLYVVSDVQHFTINGFLLTIYIAFLVNIVKVNRIYILLVSAGTMIFNLFAFNGDIARMHWDLSIFCIILFSSYYTGIKSRGWNVPLRMVSLLYGTLVYWSFLLDNQSKIIPFEFDFVF